MNRNDTHQTSRALERSRASQEELVDRIARAVPNDGGAEPLAGLHLYRSSVPREPVHSVVKPAFCVIAQGSKEVLLGKSRYLYDASTYLLTTVELPRVSQVLEASSARPYLSFRLDLTPAVVGAVMAEAGSTLPVVQADERAIVVSLLDVDLQDAVLRLVRLMDSPAAAPVLMPLISREIVYRLLMGDQGARLRHLALAEGHTTYIASTIARLRRDYDRPLRIEQLAGDLGMSVSSFHHHFKAVTALSPLQYQKRLRLQEARRLMLSEDFDAASAAYRVGYQDASHFNREYKGLFGFPPLRDVQRLRLAANVDAGG